MPSAPVRRCPRLAALLLAGCAPLVLPVGSAFAQGCPPSPSASPVASASPSPSATPTAIPGVRPTATPTPTAVPTAVPTASPTACASATPSRSASPSARPAVRQGPAGSSRVPLLFGTYQPPALSSREDSAAPPPAPLPSGTFQPDLPYAQPPAEQLQALREDGERPRANRSVALASGLLLLLVAAHLRQLSRRRPD